MSRIRSIKPEVLDDEKAAQLSDGAWRLWVSSWMLADDFGNFRASPVMLRGRIFWGRNDRPEDVKNLLKELVSAGMIKLYRANSEDFAHIRGFKKHQRIDNAGKAKYPAPREGNSIDEVESSEEIREQETFAALSLEGKGGDGKGVAINPAPENGDLFSVPKAVLDREKKKGESKTESKTEKASNVFEAVNAARVRLGLEVIRKSPATLSLILDRISAGQTVEECLHVISVTELEAKADPEKTRWLNATSPFSEKSFAVKLSLPLSVAQLTRRTNGNGHHPQRQKLKPLPYEPLYPEEK